MKSSSKEGSRAIGSRRAAENPVLVATRLTLRGATGRLTARLVPDGINQLKEGQWVLVGRPPEPLARRRIEALATYGRKVVLKFEGVDGVGDAAALVGQDILLPCNGLVDLPEGTYYIFELIGLRVFTRDGREIGVVRDVLSTGGAPLLVIDPAGIGQGAPREEILLPAARSICRLFDVAAGRIVVDPPEGLLELYGI